MPPLQLQPILKYPGGKWRVAHEIIRYFPPHRHYVEPYCGSAAVFFVKAPTEHEVLNDISSDLVNLFRVIRQRGEELVRAIYLTPWSEEEYVALERDWADEDELEWARRYLVRCWQAHGTQLGKTTNGWRHNGLRGRAYPTKREWAQLPERLLAVVDRLKQAEIRQRPALEIITYYNAPDVLLYVDPPYIRSTRRNADRHYAHEMTDEDHRCLLDALEQHQGMIVLSGYPHPLYEERLAHWQRVEFMSMTEQGQQHIEVLWINERARQMYQPSLFDSI